MSDKNVEMSSLDDEETNRHLREIFEDYNNPLKREKLANEKKRKQIAEEKDYGDI